MNKLLFHAGLSGKYFAFFNSAADGYARNFRTALGSQTSVARTQAGKLFCSFANCCWRADFFIDYLRALVDKILNQSRNAPRGK